VLAIADVFWFVDCFHPEDGGDIFFRNVGSYKNHTSQKTTLFIVKQQVNN
jgi:hypothetical protein